MKKRISYILLIIFLLILNINVIEAAACKTSDNALQPTWGYCPQSTYGDIIVTKVSGKQYLKEYKYWHYARQFSHRDVYCTKHGDKQPVYNVCELDNSLYSDSVRAAIGYIMANYSSDYAKTQYLIHQVLAAKAVGVSVPGNYYSKEYNNAISQHDNYENGVPGTYYLATLYNCGDGIQSIADGYTEVIKYKIIYHGNGGVWNDQTEWSNTVNSGASYTVEPNFFTRNGHTFQGWTTNSNGVDDGHNWTGWSGTWNYKNGEYGISNYELHLYARWKADIYTVTYHGNGGVWNDQTEWSNTVNSGASYTVEPNFFTRKGYTFQGWTINSDGTPDSDNVHKSMWYQGWSGPWIYTNGEYGISNNELVLYARWQDSCEYDFIHKYNNNPTPANRLALYKKYHRGAWNSESRRNLLNFRILDAETVCGNYTPSYGTNNACLKTDQVNSETENNFTNQNISDYNDIIISSSITDQSYCLTDFELNKGENVGYNSNKLVKAGRMIFNIDKEDAVAKGTITKTCYIHKDVYNNYIGDITKEKFINVNDYMDKITLAEVELSQIPIKSVPTSKTDGDFYKVEGKVEITYKPNPIYAEKITGKQNNNCVDSTGRINDTCRLLGYGVASKFNDANLTNPSFNFSITPSLNSIFSFNTNDTCPYKVEPEIIKYKNTNDKGHVDLEFRTIDTTKPFNRRTKTNWSFGTNNNSNNNVVKENITNADVNNSYDRTKGGSLYTNQLNGKKRIILTPNLVQKIRDYTNGEGDYAGNPHPYNNYELSCENGVCSNAFLKEFEIVK